MLYDHPIPPWSHLWGTPDTPAWALRDLPASPHRPSTAVGKPRLLNRKSSVTEQAPWKALNQEKLPAFSSWYKIPKMGSITSTEKQLENIFIFVWTIPVCLINHSMIKNWKWVRAGFCLPRRRIASLSTGKIHTKSPTKRKRDNP